MVFRWLRSSKRGGYGSAHGRLACPECNADVAADCLCREACGYDLVQQTKAEVFRKLPPY